MSPKDIYTHNIETQIEIAKGHLETWRINAKNAIAEDRIDYINQVGEYELMFDAIRYKLKELVDASEDAWEHLKEGVETALTNLSEAVRAAAEKYRK